MKKFKTVIDESVEEFDFLCYENSEPINMGDPYIFFFCGIADVQKCDSETIKYEINKNDRVRKDFGDMVTGFWRNCYKIKETNFNLENI